MPLRVMQIYVPGQSGPTPDALLEGRQILGQWKDSDTDQTVLHLLVPAEETEPIMDQFEHHFSGVAGFHVVLFPVEAVLPRPQEPDPPPSKLEMPEEESAPELNRISREELYAQVEEGIGVSRVFLGMTILSAVVAAVGLMRDDVAVIIGAMVIAPLLGPNVAMALATTLGDTGLLRRAVVTNFVGIGVAFLFAILAGAVFEVDPEVPAIAARTKLGWGDILLALSAGSAGTLAFTQGLSGAVIGVMVAVALMPPLVASGLLLGGGYTIQSSGALLLTCANIVCINLAGIFTFLFQGVRPRSWWEAERAKSGTRKATLIWVVLLALLATIVWMSDHGNDL